MTFTEPESALFQLVLQQFCPIQSNRSHSKMDVNQPHLYNVFYSLLYSMESHIHPKSFARFMHLRLGKRYRALL